MGERERGGRAEEGAAVSLDALLSICGTTARGHAHNPQTGSLVLAEGRAEWLGECPVVHQETRVYVLACTSVCACLSMNRSLPLRHAGMEGPACTQSAVAERGEEEAEEA